MRFQAQSEYVTQRVNALAFQSPPDFREAKPFQDCPERRRSITLTRFAE